MNPLPLLISIPHGGSRVPEELRERICISETEILEDIDAFAIDIYDLSPGATRVVKSEIARTFVDLNRALDQLPSRNPDGVIKSSTSYKRPIYQSGQEPDEQLVARLIERYYQPYHRQIREAVRQPGIELALDCHSMAPVGPPISPDVGKKRPLICLSNRYGESCPPSGTERLAECFRHAFSLSETEVTINQPFAGGYITRTYGGKPIPWVQVEMSRALYLKPPWFDPGTLRMDEARLAELNVMFEQAVRVFFQ